MRVGEPKIQVVYGLMVCIAFAAAMLVGCQALHRDIEQFDGEDVQFSDTEDAQSADTEDAQSDAEDAPVIPDGGECTPGGACGPCDMGQWECDDQNQLQCVGAVDIDGDDDEHCGECGAVCDSTISTVFAFCDGGNCIRQCPNDDHTACEDEGLCVDLQSDVDHCGSCGDECPTNIPGAEGVECLDGECSIECVNGWTYCEEVESCVDLENDVAHCGQCNEPCAGGNQCCQEGECVGGGNC